MKEELVATDNVELEESGRAPQLAIVVILQEELVVSGCSEGIGELSNHIFDCR